MMSCSYKNSLFKTFNLPKNDSVAHRKKFHSGTKTDMRLIVLFCLFDRQTDLQRKGVVKFTTMKNDQKMKLINIIRLLASY